MKALLWLFALFALAAGLTVAARYNEGYALLVLPPYRVELSLNLLLILLMAGFLLGYTLLRLFFHTLNLPQAVLAFRQRRQREKAVQCLRDANRMLFEGRYGQAIAMAAQAFELGESRGVSALIAARAASALRDEPRTQEWLERAAAQGEAESRIARLMTEAELHLNARRFEEALASLTELHQSGLRHIAALRIELRVRQGLNQWKEVLRLVRQLEKHHALSDEHAASLKLRAHQENIHAIATMAADAGSLSQYWLAIPATERHPRLAETTARALLATRDGVGAQKIIEQQLEQEWDSDLALVYAQCSDGDVIGRIARAENWLKTRPRDAMLLLALGRLCLRQQLWGKAQSYLEASLSVEPLRAAHLELAKLFEQLERTEDAHRHYLAAATALA